MHYRCAFDLESTKGRGSEHKLKLRFAWTGHEFVRVKKSLLQRDEFWLAIWSRVGWHSEPQAWYPGHKPGWEVRSLSERKAHTTHMDGHMRHVHLFESREHFLSQTWWWSRIQRVWFRTIPYLFDQWSCFFFFLSLPYSFFSPMVLSDVSVTWCDLPPACQMPIHTLLPVRSGARAALLGSGQGVCFLPLWLSQALPSGYLVLMSTPHPISSAPSLGSCLPSWAIWMENSFDVRALPCFCQPSWHLLGLLAFPWARPGPPAADLPEVLPCACGQIPSHLPKWHLHPSGLPDSACDFIYLSLLPATCLLRPPLLPSHLWWGTPMGILWFWGALYESVLFLSKFSSLGDSEKRGEL